jgi:hypothetical protein
MARHSWGDDEGERREETILPDSLPTVEEEDTSIAAEDFDVSEIAEEVEEQLDDEEDDESGGSVVSFGIGSIVALVQGIVILGIILTVGMFVVGEMQEQLEIEESANLSSTFTSVGQALVGYQPYG